MNQKITSRALAKLVGKTPDELVSFTLRTTMAFSEKEMDLLAAWNGRLLYDNGMMAIVVVPASRVSDLAEWEFVVDII